MADEQFSNNLKLLKCKRIDKEALEPVTEAILKNALYLIDEKNQGRTAQPK